MRKGISVIKENLDYRGFWCNPRSRPSSVAIGAVCGAYAGVKWPLVSRGVFMGLLQGGTAKITPDNDFSECYGGSTTFARECVENACHVPSNRVGFPQARSSSTWI